VGQDLWAERLARWLANKTLELGVDVLACATRHRLRDDEWLNLYGWWPDDRKPPILIFSVAGFDQLAAEGPATDRVIANAMVTALAGFYGNISTHDRAPAECPMAFNPRRDFQHLVGRQAFDARCRKLLAPRLGAKLGGLDALLKAFR
jgi:hypothetical protein